MGDFGFGIADCEMTIGDGFGAKVYGLGRTGGDTYPTGRGCVGRTSRSAG